MPIWLRRFTYNSIQEYYNKQNEEAKSTTSNKNSKTIIDPSGKINKEEYKKIKYK